MCLTNPDPKPTRKYGVGYKSVEKMADGVYTCYDHRPHAGSVVYPLNEWITDPNTGKASTYLQTQAPYLVGFHILLNLPEEGSALGHSYYQGRDIRIIKVKFRQVVATQTKDADGVYGPQVVARQIMNLGEV